MFKKVTSTVFQILKSFSPLQTIMIQLYLGDACSYLGVLEVAEFFELLIFSLRMERINLNLRREIVKSKEKLKLGCLKVNINLRIKMLRIY